MKLQNNGQGRWLILGGLVSSRGVWCLSEVRAVATSDHLPISLPAERGENWTIELYYYLFTFIRVELVGGTARNELRGSFASLIADRNVFRGRTANRARSHV